MAEKTTLPPFVLLVSVAEVSRFVPTFVVNIGDVYKAKRGDWVRLMVKFRHHCEYCDAPDGKNCRKEGSTDYEILSGKIAGVNAITPGRTGLAKVKILSNPAQTRIHSLSYGDEITLAIDYILDYIELKPDRVAEEDYLLTGVAPEPRAINAEDQKLRDRVKSMPALAPAIEGAGRGKRYWLRNGAAVTVWTQRGQVFLGKTDDGVDLEWNAAGQNADRQFDIVKDPKVSEVLA
jgi:hypothetical protein